MSLTQTCTHTHPMAWTVFSKWAKWVTYTRKHRNQYTKSTHTRPTKPTSTLRSQVVARQSSEQAVNKSITSCFSVFDTKTQYFFVIWYYSKRRALTVCFFSFVFLLVFSLIWFRFLLFTIPNGAVQSIAIYTSTMLETISLTISL